MPTNNNGTSQNGWNEWSRHVLKELERLNTNYEDLQKSFAKETQEMQKNFTKEIQDIKIELATLKTKAGVWGLVAGAIPVIIALAIQFLKQH